MRCLIFIDCLKHIPCGDGSKWWTDFTKGYLDSIKFLKKKKLSYYHCFMINWMIPFNTILNLFKFSRIFQVASIKTCTQNIHNLLLNIGLHSSSQPIQIRGHSFFNPRSKPRQKISRLLASLSECCSFKSILSRCTYSVVCTNAPTLTVWKPQLFCRNWQGLTSIRKTN